MDFEVLLITDMQSYHNSQLFVFDLLYFNLVFGL